MFDQKSFSGEKREKVISDIFTVEWAWTVDQASNVSAFMLAKSILYVAYTSALERPPGLRSMSIAPNSLSSLNPMWPFSFWPKSNNCSSAFWEKWIQNILSQFVRNMLKMELRKIHHWIRKSSPIILDILQLKLCSSILVLQKLPKYAN